MMKKLIKYLILLLFVMSVTIGCESFLTPSMDQQKTTGQAIQDVNDLQKAVNGAINILSFVSIYGRDFPVTNVVSSDNAYSTGASGRFLIQDAISYTPNSGYPGDLWEDSYAAIANLNMALQQSTKLKDSKQVNYIRGQAYALKGLIYLNLLMSFGQQYVNNGTKPGGIPFRVGFGSEHAKNIPRLTVEASWDSIGLYFKKAVALMKPLRSQSFDETHMNYWAARGLQSRYALYRQKWGLVKKACKDIINNGPFHIISAQNYVSTWASGSGPQSLFEIAYTSSDHYTYDSIASIYRVIPGAVTYHDIVVTPDLYNIYGKSDVRRKLFTVHHTKKGNLIRMSGKYVNPIGLDNVRVIRYAEIVLNYAEALARTGQSQKALVQLTKITSNRNVSSYKKGSLENVLLERRKELAMEGFRFFDLLRNHKPIVPGSKRSNLQQTLKPGNYRLALPLPVHEINANGKIKQNKGYGTG